MSLFHRRERGRGKVAAGLMTIGALVAFQALAIVGAQFASAVTACTYNPATDTINITIDPNGFAAVAVDDASDIDPAAPSGAILFSDGGAFTACGSASNSNTTAIVVLGQPGADEFFYLDNGGWNGGAPFSSSIAWSIDMGTNTVGGFDEVDIYLVHEGANDDSLTLTDTGFTFNGATGEMLGVEASLVRGFDGDDTLDGSAAVNLVTWLHAGPGDDWAALGAVAGPTAAGLFDDARGGSDIDQLSYATRTTCTVVDAPSGEAGHDVNCDGDLGDAGDEIDTFVDFEIYETGSGNDTLIG